MRGGRRRFLLTVATAFAVSEVGVCLAQNSAQEPDEPVVDLGPGITPPRVIHQVSPEPDAGTGGFRLSGVVLIGLVVSSQGMPREVHVVKSLDKDLDRNAVEAVQQWRFEPARKGDRPLAVRVTVEIRFRDL
jgi:TonB family protein